MKDEMEIEFLGQKRKLSLPKLYSEFIEKCKKTFYLSEERSRNLSFAYVKDGKEENFDEDEYDEDPRKADYWKLFTNEDEEEQGDAEIISLAKDELANKKRELLNEAKKFKENLFTQYNQIVAEKIKEKNKQHQENIQKIKENYKKQLKEFENEMNEQIKDVKKKLSEKIMSKYENSIKTIDNGVKEQLLPRIKELNNECKKELNTINLNEIDKEMKNLRQSLSNCQNVVTNKLQENISFKIQDLQKSVNLNEAREGISIELAVTKMNNSKITGNFVLEIVNEEDRFQSYKVDIDLSDLRFNEKGNKTINFNPHIQNSGTYNYKLKIKKGYDDISNEAELELEITDVGSNQDLFN